MKQITTLEQYKKSKKKRRILIVLSQVLILILFLFWWEIAARTGMVNSFLVSSPSAVFSLFLTYCQSGTLWTHIRISVLETIIGLVIGTAAGFLIATVLYLLPTVSKIFDPYLVVLNALPKTALAPILIIWAGTNLKGIVVVSVSLSIVVTILSTLSYFASVDENLVRMMRTMGASKLQILLKVVYPSNLENLLSVIKVNIGMSWVGVIVGEFLVSREGIGYLVVYGGQVFKLDLVMMGVFVLAVIALLMYECVSIAERILRRHRNRVHR